MRAPGQPGSTNVRIAPFRVAAVRQSSIKLITIRTAVAGELRAYQQDHLCFFLTEARRDFWGCSRKETSGAIVPGTIGRTAMGTSEVDVSTVFEVGMFRV